MDNDICSAWRFMILYDFGQKNKVNAMHILTLLHKTLEKELPQVHKIRLNNLLDAARTVIGSNKLTLTGLGRYSERKIKVRHNIKRVDRLLGNEKLDRERRSFYQWMNRHVLDSKMQPWIHVDWSCICSKTKLYVLRASLSMSGRSIVVYEKCYPKKNENHHPTHEAFLDELKRLLPSAIKPVIVTDAGFRCPWFRYVQSLGWDFVGRLRNRNLVCFENEIWQLSGDLYEKATGKATDIGQGMLTKKQKFHTRFILCRGAKVGCNTSRKKNVQVGIHSKHGRQRRSHAEPWLLVTSLDHSNQKPETIVQIYRQRMRIEENFRDTKSTRYGFGLKESRSRSTQRMNALLLIAAIATFACWMAGILLRDSGCWADFQAHSAKYKCALSFVFLGKEGIRKAIDITKTQFDLLLNTLSHIATSQQVITT